MRWLGSVALLSAAMALTACGAAENQRAQPARSPAPAPPIEAIDEPRPDVPFTPREEEGTFNSYLICQGVVDQAECRLSPEQEAAMRDARRRHMAAITPAPDSTPRAIARLRLEKWGRATKATMIAWPARSGKLCTWLEVGDEDSAGGGPSGPCVPETASRKACDEICLVRSGEGDGKEMRFLLAGTVTARAEELRITFVDGRAIRYPLIGPVVPEFPDVRVFMLDLGPEIHRRLELLSDGEVLERSEVPQREIDFERCWRQIPPPQLPEGPGEAMPKGGDAQLKDCLRKGSQEQQGRAPG